jgi:hypothetical protein
VPGAEPPWRWPRTGWERRGNKEGRAAAIPHDRPRQKSAADQHPPKLGQGSRGVVRGRIGPDMGVVGRVVRNSFWVLHGKGTSIPTFVRRRQSWDSKQQNATRVVSASVLDWSQLRQQNPSFGKTGGEIRRIRGELNWPGRCSGTTRPCGAGPRGDRRWGRNRAVPRPAEYRPASRVYLRRAEERRPAGR